MISELEENSRAQTGTGIISAQARRRLSKSDKRAAESEPRCGRSGGAVSSGHSVDLLHQ
jgi:hypothetical protein